ncbi:MAG: hypothetical protein US50_C0010G0003 [Candidatus Nomurabacteria bacterium GW2011_GWB1_37_5]|uniref:Thioredoxin domain-containing protein n=1 Tax=Candidatus Nomurabacteria bacterium GW2011_GWB1_37_5 TaxID=1618742 RepID=A0A0G0HAT1_9BACT|nr:MAG: hypothetical protein US50_C0010G0003 [Candidatus Nomurabacteria bacterium GW2011_GWB1_37_5]
MDWKKYISVFIITLALFMTALYTGNFFNTRKIEQVKNIQDKISIDILSSETKFSLLEELSCKDVDNTFLSEELGDLAAKIEYSDKNINGSREEILGLKRYYSLLEIKDYILMKRVRDRCGLKSIFVLYFYSNNEDCSDCEKQGYVLTALREKYPEFRVYSFDYNVDLSAVRALIDVYKVKNEMPAMVINGKVYNGFQSVEDIEKILPEIKKLQNTEDINTEESNKKPQS